MSVDSSRFPIALIGLYPLSPRKLQIYVIVSFLGRSRT